jgi:hypothetical protein
MSAQDLKAVRAFVSNPAGGMSAVQTGETQNPFGDYAPQSDQITGILKGLYDSFVASLEKSNTEEDKSQKTFEELMESKKQELKSLTSSLDTSELEFAEKTQTLTQDKEQLDDTKVDLESAETLFTETEATCKEKAKEFELRSQLRKRELDGIQKAREILNSKEAAKAFKGAAALFVQLGQSQHRVARLHNHAGLSAGLRGKTYAKLRTLAAKYSSLDMARVAVQVKSGDAFDKVIMMIDHMVTDLRNEEQEDIKHRDRCENSENANSNEKDDLAHAATTMKEEIERLEDAQKAMEKEVSTNDQESKDIQKEMDDRLKLRNEENAEYLRAMEADSNAVKTITSALEALNEFYEKTGKKGSSQGAVVRLKRSGRTSRRKLRLGRSRMTRTRRLTRRMSLRWRVLSRRRRTQWKPLRSNFRSRV